MLPPSTQSVGPCEVEWSFDDRDQIRIVASGGNSEDRRTARLWVQRQFEDAGFERTPMVRQSSWADVMAKAKRLIQSGQVTVLRNSMTNVIGHVIGDHGEYNTELSREDPNSGVITQWQCECPWAQYSWGRTRQWKKYEGRVCAHALALYWKSRSTPLDDAPQGQAMPGQRVKPMTPPISPGMGAPAAPPASPAVGPPPGAPSILPQTQTPQAPPAQGEQMSLFGPQEAPGAGVIPPYPGEQMSLFENWQGPGTTPGGGVSPPWAISVPGAKQPSPFNPIQNFQTYSKVAAEKFNQGDRVVLKEDEWGTKEGKDQDGEWKLVPAGTPGQVFDFDPTTGLMSVLFELHGGELTSYHVRCFVDQNSVKPVGGRSPLDPGLTPKRPLI